MKKARDVREQLEGLLERVEIEKTTVGTDSVPVRKVPPCVCAACTISLSVSVSSPVSLFVYVSLGVCKCKNMSGLWWWWVVDLTASGSVDRPSARATFTTRRG
jgi:hypothetical protein